MKKHLLTLIILTILSIQFVSCREDITSPTEDSSTENIDFTVQKEIFEPSEGVVWNPGKTYSIKWKGAENLDKIKIELVRKFNYILTISESTLNDGSFAWKIPYNLPYMHHYRIKLRSANSSSTSVFSVEFNIQEVP